MIITKDLFGKEHTILPCRAEDVDVHFSKISDVIPSEEVIQFKQRMSECINAGSAYTLSDGSCFLYYLNYELCCANGVALYGKNCPNKMLALFAGIFTKADTDTFLLSFAMHPGKFANEYKSIATLSSLKRQRIEGYPLIIRIDELKKKLLKLYSKCGIKWVV